MRMTIRGSSPRGRGKPGPLRGWAPKTRLIPAWAGKTSANCTMLRRKSGSSPRGRGKPTGARRTPGRSRLIPAWAGKTDARSRHWLQAPAHPRVGGENGQPVVDLIINVGSSPRGRGKHFLTCAFIERIGQILETLELAVSSESYTLSAAYATDAPQDQARNTALVLPSSRGAS